MPVTRTFPWPMHKWHGDLLAIHVTRLAVLEIAHESLVESNDDLKVKLDVIIGLQETAAAKHEELVSFVTNISDTVVRIRDRSSGSLPPPPPRRSVSFESMVSEMAIHVTILKCGVRLESGDATVWLLLQISCCCQIACRSNTRS